MANLLQRPLFANVLRSDDIANLRSNAEVISHLEGRRLFVFEGRPYFVDYDLMKQYVSLIIDKLEHEDGDDRFTVKTLIELQPFFFEAKGDDKKPIHVPPLYSFITQNSYDTLDWPVPNSIHGAICALGDTGAGKTYLLRHAKKIDFIVRFGEPFEDIDLDAISIPGYSFFNSLTTAMLLSILGYRVAIDSLRSLVYGLSGNPMEGGMVAALFDVCTQINNLIADVGCVIIVAINPMLSDPAKASRLFTRLGASVAGAIHIVDHAEVASTFRLMDGRVTTSASPQLEAKEGVHDPRADGFEHKEGVGTLLSVARLGENTAPARTATAYGAGTNQIDEEDSVRPSFTFNL